MANLRANKITTGTADYQGSIYANGVNAYLLTTTTAPGTDDFTIECWINSDAASSGTQEGVFAINAVAHGFQSGASNQLRLAQGRDGTDGQNGGLEVNLNGTYVGTGDGNDIIQEGTWHHIAVTRASGTVKIWVDGVEKASGSAAGDVTGTTFITGYYDGNYTYQGYMSNFRYRKGTAHYTTTFTPPTGPLERTSDTELLFAQSVNNAGDGYSSAIHGGTTNIMQVNGNVTANTSAPTLTTTSDVGVVFDGDTKVNSQSYMYFPTGDTSQRSRGRGFRFGGDSPTKANHIEFVNIQSQGIAQDFGDLLTTLTQAHGGSSSIRTIIFAGYNAPATVSDIQYFTNATQGNSIDAGINVGGDFGRYVNVVSNEVRSVYGGGTPGYTATMEYVTNASLSSVTDFGDFSAGGMYSAATMNSSTRGIFAGGYYNPGGGATQLNTIQYITIMTTGNSQDFGDMVANTGGPHGICSSPTRGIAWAAGNSIQYLTIPTLGNAVDFGDATQAGFNSGVSFSSHTRGVAGGGYNNPGSGNNNQKYMNYVTISTTGNASDFGDLRTRGSSMGGSSDCHGGLS